MKHINKVVLTIFAFLMCMALYGQTKEVHVILKNGTTIPGNLVEIDPTSHIVINIAGIDTRIGMEKVESIKAENAPKPEAIDVPIAKQTEAVDAKPSAQAVNLPGSLKLKLGEIELEFILVKGGDRDMGYDGRHSVSYRSEPVHPVRISPFYMSKSTLTNEQVAFLHGKKIALASSLKKPYKCSEWKEAKQITEKLTEILKYNVRLISEAEWEYVALNTLSNYIDKENNSFEWCEDGLVLYRQSDRRVVDPIGPIGMETHVVRKWTYQNNEVYRRFADSEVMEPPYVRVVIPGADYMKVASQSK